MPERRVSTVWQWAWRGDVLSLLRLHLTPVILNVALFCCHLCPFRCASLHPPSKRLPCHLAGAYALLAFLLVVLLLVPPLALVFTTTSLLLSWRGGGEGVAHYVPLPRGKGMAAVHGKRCREGSGRCLVFVHTSLWYFFMWLVWRVWGSSAYLCADSSEGRFRRLHGVGG